MKILHLISLLILLFASSCAQPEVLTREEVLAVVNRFDDAWKTKNVKEVDSVLSASYIYFTQSGGTFERHNVVTTAGSPDYLLDTVYRKHLDIKIEGNTAIVNTIWTGKGSYFNTPFNDRQRCSMIITKYHGKVQVLSEHCTPIK